MKCPQHLRRVGGSVGVGGVGSGGGGVGMDGLGMRSVEVERGGREWVDVKPDTRRIAWECKDR